MILPIGTSVRRLTLDRWILGSSKVCERFATAAPQDNIVSCGDGNITFCLRELTEEDHLFVEDGLNTDLIHEGRTSSAAEKIKPNAVCKVKAWCEGLESEGNTIQLVERNVPSVPLPRVIYSWVDY
jgi:hypothetical protein